MRECSWKELVRRNPNYMCRQRSLLSLVLCDLLARALVPPPPFLHSKSSAVHEGDKLLSHERSCNFLGFYCRYHNQINFIYRVSWFRFFIFDCFYFSLSSNIFYLHFSAGVKLSSSTFYQFSTFLGLPVYMQFSSFFRVSICIDWFLVPSYCLWLLILHSYWMVEFKNLDDGQNDGWPIFITITNVF